MSSFTCNKCGETIIDTPRGYTTGCQHYPLERQKKVHIEPLTEEQKEKVYELARRLAYGTTWEDDDFT